MGASRKPGKQTTHSGAAATPGLPARRQSPPPGTRPDAAADPWRAALDSVLLQATETALAGLPAGAACGVALSAGADSAMLAVHAAYAARRLGLRLHCFHIHHGLQADADDWLIRAHRLAGLLQADCHSRRVAVDIDGRGM